MGKQLPKGWVYPKLKEVVKYQKGKKPKILKDEPFLNSEPYLDIKAFEKDEIRRYADVDSSHLIKENEIGIVWDGARSGWVGMNKKGAVGSTIAILRPLLLNEIYLFRFLQSKFDYINENTRGSGIPHVDPSVLWDIDFPLPPRAEQDRIVVKVDALMAQHAAIQQAMERIPQLLKDFRQQVLTQAVTGKLTEDWRVGKELEEWEESSIGDLIIEIQAGKNFSCPSIPVSDGNVGLVKISAVTWGTFDEKETKTVFDKERIRPEYFIEKGDFLMARANTIELVGLPVIVDEISHDIMISDKVWRIQFKNEDFKFFIKYFLHSNLGRTTVTEIASGNQHSMRNLSQKKFKNVVLPIPKDLELKEIVRRVESLFEKATAIEQRYEQLKTHIDSLPQAILHKAFKGELVEQLDNDGSASELLKEIEEMRLDSKKKK